MLIAVLTWKLHNFGTALQAYALVKYISEIEGEGNCKLLNYTLPGREQLVRCGVLTFKEFLEKAKNHFEIQRKERKNRKTRIYYERNIQLQHYKFRDFYARIPHDDHRVCLAEREYFDRIYDKVIVGSDQVWNPKYFCETYFLDFVSDEKKYSYGPSLGVNFLKKEEKQYLKSKLKNHFQNICVRETTGRKLLEGVLPEEKITCVVDPTLLYDGKQWTSMLHLHSDEDQDYIIVYTLSGNGWYKEVVSKIQKVIGIEEVIYITPEDNLYFYKNEKNLKTDLGPIEFLSLIKNAKYVITDSFHGVCFALNFEKNFICLNRFNNKGETINENSRILDLLENLEISDCFCNNKLNIKRTIDYENVNVKLNTLRSHSQNYLKKLLYEDKKMSRAKDCIRVKKDT